jgi:hypothetical protein
MVLLGCLGLMIAGVLAMMGCYSLPTVRTIQTIKGPVQVITLPQHVLEHTCRSIAKQRGQEIYLKDNGKPFTAFEGVAGCADWSNMVIYIMEGAPKSVEDHEVKHIEEGK